MITHYIIMSSSYSKGKRIALDYTIEKDVSDERIEEIVTNIVSECGRDVSISTHSVQTDSKEWSSIVEKDYFFKGVEVIATQKEFIELIRKDRELIGLDVAKYIISKIKCTHLKLEKLVYLCFADYLCKMKKELFKDRIYAYKYGPVTKSVYEEYKVYGCKPIDDETIDSKKVLEMPAKSRILFAEDGIDRIKSIDATLKKYGNYSARELVEITHRESTPWDKTGKGFLFNRTIEKETILKYHVNECL